MKIAEKRNGPIPRPVAFNYVWGDALAELQHRQPDLRIINLETSVTTSGDFWPRKGIHCRMHPHNTPVITAAAIDCCVLANNHVLDWGYRVPDEQQEFAHRLIDEAAIDIIHGHSSHHPRPIEVYRNKPVLYGCGDLINDYEGIGTRCKVVKRHP